jgi:hypothetical protein
MPEVVQRPKIARVDARGPVEVSVQRHAKVGVLDERAQAGHLVAARHLARRNRAPPKRPQLPGDVRGVDRELTARERPHALFPADSPARRSDSERRRAAEREEGEREEGDERHEVTSRQVHAFDA